MKLSELKKLEGNPRTISKEDMERLKESIKKFGVIEGRPFLVSNRTGENIIIGGNQRYEACKALGIKEVPVHIMEGLTEEQEREIIIRDNVSNGEWDMDILANEWEVEQLKDWGVDINFTVEEPTVEEDDFEVDEGIQTDIVLGDLFEIGPHRLLCGDSTNIDDVNKLMNGDKAELLFTSPPYSDMREYNGGKDLSIGKLKEFISTFGPFCEYQAINLGIQRKVNDIVQYWDDYIKEAKDFGYLFLAWNVWHKSGVSIGQQSSFIPIYHEWIFVFGNRFKNINKTWERKAEISKKTKINRRQADGSMKLSSIGLQDDKKEMESVFYSNSELGEIRKEHPATFPVELPSEYIKAITNIGDIVVEPFAGSGTTMVASHLLNRKCYGMELDQKYCQTIVNRMQKLAPDIEIKRNGILYEKPEISG